MSSSQRRLRRTATVAAAASLAILCAVQAVQATPRGASVVGRDFHDPFEFADLSRPITADPGFNTAGLGNADAVAQAAGQSGQPPAGAAVGDGDDDGAGAGDDNAAVLQDGGISIGPNGVDVDDLHVGNGHVSIGDDDMYVGPNGVWIGIRAAQDDKPAAAAAAAPGAAAPAAATPAKAADGDQTDKGPQVVWTWEAGALGCPGVENSNAKVCTGTVAAGASGSGPSLDARSMQQQHRRQFDSDAASASYEQADIFPQFTSYVTMTRATSSYVNFGPDSNLNTSVPAPRSRAVNDSGNGQAPTNINNPDSPDLGWLDTIVGAVPYKNGDLAASVVWILATICLIPLLLIRLLRRSSLISSVLFTIIVYMVLMMVGFGMRARLSDQTPSTGLMMAMSIILAVLLPLLLEPLIALLGLYAGQSGRPTGVPTAAAVLRALNLVVFILFLVAAAYDASWMKQWDDALRNRYTAQDLPSIQPPGVVRIAPVVASIVEIILILGTALLIPVARGDNGSMRPGGYIFLLLVLLFISCVYRLLQTLHATSRLSEENGGSGSSSDLLPFFSGGSSSSTTDDERVANGLSLAPQGMYGPKSEGIAWEQLQLTMASRGNPQTPVIFNLVYIFPMWLMVFLLFFAHAPGKKKGGDADGDGGDGATATATATA
ncbi:uncharacterized protein PFL1_01877 [Pseudozyma flocculosa PF-1]|uniref:uncharacterized protein n=1 Tax=Pseudozyma flocculosa PF-1 TaxID=1277687 RepID=UPI000456111A|nr:uncharacterized protein PFL1_01877 [Pseudozyma flocculosa PF-1]EPQ30351.1 hypothetical protein PFL1_01877 [Pseudozyma flocculosa PF-1]